MRDATIELWDWLAINDEPTESDLIFTFGGAVVALAEKSAELYHKGLGDLVIVTGNTGTFGNPEWKEPCADIFEKYLISHSVPTESILVQNKSMNTLEDVTFTKELLATSKSSFSSAIIVSRPVHQRRSSATFQKQFPQVRLTNVPCSEPHPKDLADDLLYSAALRCVQEYERLIEYGEKGDLIGQSVSPNITSAYNTLKQLIS